MSKISLLDYSVRSKCFVNELSNLPVERAFGNIFALFTFSFKVELPDCTEGSVSILSV